MNEPERTPEQKRNDRRAGIGCSGLVLLAGIACVIGGFSILSNKGTHTQARILNCDFRVPKQPYHCRGIWSTGDLKFDQGYVDGASRSDVGKRIDVIVNDGKAKKADGRTLSAVIVFLMAAICIAVGAVMARSVWRARPG